MKISKYLLYIKHSDIMENNSGNTYQSPFWEEFEWQKQNYPEIYNLDKINGAYSTPFVLLRRFSKYFP